MDEIELARKRLEEFVRFPTIYGAGEALAEQVKKVQLMLNDGSFPKTEVEAVRLLGQIWNDLNAHDENSRILTASIACD